MVKNDDKNDKSAFVMLNNVEPYSTDYQWSVYIQRLKNKFQLYDIPEGKQVLILLDVIGLSTYERLLDLCEPNKPESKSFLELEEILGSFFEIKRSKYIERLKFSKCCQSSTESIQEFSVRIKGASRYCKFPKDWLQDALITQFINGLYNDDQRQKIFSLDEIKDFKSLVELTSNMALADCLSKTKVTADTINDSNTFSVSKVSSQKYEKRISNERKQPCFHCNRTNHDSSDCFFKDSVCKFCKEKGHISWACKNKIKYSPNENSKFKFRGNWKTQTVPEGCPGRKIHAHNVDYESNFEVDDREETVNTSSTSKTEKPIYTKLWLNGKQCSFMVDTGSMLTLISYNVFSRMFPVIKLEPAKVKLTTYTGTPIQVYGKTKVNVESSISTDNVELDIYVVEGNLKSLVGRDWLRAIQLDWTKMLKQRFTNIKANLVQMEKKINHVEKDVITKLVTKYKQIFQEGVGKIPSVHQASIHLKSNEAAVFRKPFKVPLAIEPLVSNEIHRLLKEGIISKVSHSEFATPVVPVFKKNGSVRLCGNYKVTLNPLLLIDQHPIPSVDQVTSKIGGKSFYSKLDVSQAFTHIEVREEDRKKLTINTHKGLYQMNRLPFGIASAPAIWQETIEKILVDIPNIVIMFDDIAIGTNSRSEHLATLETVFSRLNENNIRLNADKCEFFKSGIEYCGYYINKEGLNKCTDKVKAILNVCEPTNVTELKSFLGLVNFYGKFCPNLSEIASPLFDLLQKGIDFSFDEKCKKSFSRIKRLIASDTVLCVFDTTKKLILATDAGPRGISAILSHEIEGSERPICFASRSLSKVERKYSQIDREALAIVWGVKKFVDYLYGRNFTLITDNKALTSIFHPKKDLPVFSAMKMQHYALFLQNFMYDIKYRKSVDNGNADCLSRFPIPENKEETYDSFDLFEINQIETVYPVTASMLKKEVDPEVRQLVWALTNGITIERSECFGHSQEDFHLFDGCLFLGQRVYIPHKYRSQVLIELHRGHQGIVKSKALARSYVWWPRIDLDIENMVKSCKPCQSVAKSPAKTIHVWERSSAPMERLHVDFAGPFRDYYFLIITDAYSHWVQVEILKSITSEITIKCLNSFFTTFGTPHVLVSDNGPQFTSAEFQEYCKQHGIQHKLVAPYHPASNGAAERCVQTLKNSLMATLGFTDGRTFHQLNHAVQEFLVSYRKTPHCTNGQPPALLFLGRNIRSKIDLVRPVLKYDPVATLVGREFMPGDSVMVRFYNEAKWKFGKIVEKMGKLHYRVEVNGTLHRRHIDQLKSFTASQNQAERPRSPTLVTQTLNPPLDSEHTVTRRGRVIKPPVRMSL